MFHLNICVCFFCVIHSHKLNLIRFFQFFLHRSLSFILFFHFPSFSRRTTHLICRDQYTLHTHTCFQVCAHKHTHPYKYTQPDSEFLVFWNERHFAFVERTEYFLLKSQICNCSTVLLCWGIAPILALFSSDLLRWRHFLSLKCYFPAVWLTV